MTCQQWSPEAWQPLPGDICLSMRLSLPSPKATQEAKQQLLSPTPGLFLRLPEVDEKMLVPGNVLCGRGVRIWTLHSPPHHHLKGHSRAVGPDSSPKAGLGYQSWERGGMSAGLCAPAPSNA